MTGKVVLVVARADNGVIGTDNALPWHIPADLKRFKALTMGKPMIMGRKTFDSLPGILPGRRHIVLTRDTDWQAEGAERAGSAKKALSMAFRTGSEACVIGGAQIYALFLPLADQIELTEVHADIDGDTLLPAFGHDWHEVLREDHPALGDIPAYSFVTLERMK
ncbi:MAG: dihydrofolate reductase [Novosphingobium sp.]